LGRDAGSGISGQDASRGERREGGERRKGSRPSMAEAAPAGAQGAKGRTEETLADTMFGE
jgi:hypothetical protein